ncbi:hypothetical protein [Roseiconus lacunae]|uniref:Uncharacterized protein n=1 Tax=Roseiconus lacunae TaxID=2605694 RepID=A0ABT7PSU1_9BACT|nr:hypothetical protein [Roseiconus lacunae]MDM4019391.1 hypothetical protein [Roseiconus lacunae]
MQTVFKSGNEELKTLVSDTTSGSLRAYFDARISEWTAPTKDMGVFTVGVFYDLAQSFKGAAAFDLVDAAAGWSIEDMTDTQTMRYVDLLADLARSTETTEMPPNLARQWATIMDRARKIDSRSVALEFLRSHYRTVG